MQYILILHLQERQNYVCNLYYLETNKNKNGAISRMQHYCNHTHVFVDKNHKQLTIHVRGVIALAVSTVQFLSSRRSTTTQQRQLLQHQHGRTLISSRWRKSNDRWSSAHSPSRCIVFVSLSGLMSTMTLTWLMLDYSVHMISACMYVSK